MYKCYISSNLPKRGTIVRKSMEGEEGENETSMEKQMRNSSNEPIPESPVPKDKKVDLKAKKQF